MKRSTTVAAIIGSIAVGVHAQEPRFPSGIPGLDEGQEQRPGANWLLGAKDDEERFRRLQVFAGGTYEQMWQIGYRYEQVYQAIVDENWALGDYHWGKLRDVFNVALMKRPNRTPNAEDMFLNNTWEQLREAFADEDREAIRNSFLAQRGVCMACHVAEDMAFLNDAPMFRDTADFPEN